jgi:uncharacterized membrane protein
MRDIQAGYMSVMDSIYLTKIFFFLVFVACALYWISSFSDNRNIIYKLPKMHRIPYKIGLIIIMVASLNIFSKEEFRNYDLNMFLIGAVIVLAVVAYWDKRFHKYFNDEKDNIKP